MGKFLNELVVSPVDDRHWKLDKPLHFFSEKAKKIIAIPRGYITDFASVPRIPLLYLAIGGTCNEPAVVHDYLYSVHLVNRATADAVLLEACKAIGIAKWRRYLVYFGVRLFGWSHWGR